MSSGREASLRKAVTCSCRRSTSFLDLLSLTAEKRVASNFSFSHGFEMKSVAPALMARTAFSVSE